MYSVLHCSFLTPTIAGALHYGRLKPFLLNVRILGKKLKFLFFRNVQNCPTLENLSMKQVISLILAINRMVNIP